MPKRLATRLELIALSPSDFGITQSDRVSVVGTADGDFTVTLNGDPRTFAATGSTNEEIRDGLVSAINGSAEPLSAAPDPDDVSRLVVTADAVGVSYTIAVSHSVSSAANIATSNLSDPAELDLWLEIAANMINLKVWGKKASDGHRLLAAHYLASLSEDGEGEAGPLAGVTVGPASESYATAAPSSDPELGATRWGRAYLAMRRSLPRTPLAINTRATGQFPK